METILEKHGKLALKIKNSTLNAGRYSFQVKSERKIHREVISKLNIINKDKCLDVGCNVGANLIPISKKVKHITGIDQINCIEILRNKIKSKNVTLISGNFLDHDFKKNKYDKIIIYSVLHVLKNKKEAYFAINKALKLLNPGGKILIGDLPNISLKNKFTSSKSGKLFLKNWNKNKKTKKDIEAQNMLVKDPNCNLIINDLFIINLVSYLRKKGLSVFILPQNKDLPFGHTREDIVIELID